MKNPTIHIAIAAALAAALSSCNLISISGTAFDRTIDFANDTTITYAVSDFNSIACEVPSTIDYYVDSVAKCSIEMPSQLIQYVDVVSEDGMLKINCKDSKKLKNSNVDITICSPYLRSIDVSGAAEINLPDNVVSDSLDIRGSGAVKLDAGGITANLVMLLISGAGDIDIRHIECETICANVSGAGNVKVAGKAGKANISISGAGDIDLRKLDCEHVQSNTFGVGRVRRK